MESSMIALKLLVGVAGAIACFFLYRSRRIHELSSRAFTFLALGLVAGSRLGFFAAVYLVLGKDPPSDIPAYYYPEAVSALSGKLPYRDIASSYAPLFGYVGAALVRLWSTPKVFPLFAMLLEIASVPIWLFVARRLVGEKAARRAMLLYLCNAAVFHTVCVGQNQIWMSFLLAASIALAIQGRPVLSGLVGGFALSAVKLLAAMFALPLWVLSPKRKAWMLGFLALPAVVYGGFVAMGLDILQPLEREGPAKSCGNLPYLMTAFGEGPGRVAGLASMLLLLGIWGVLALSAWDEERPLRIDARLVHLISLVFLAFMILSRKSYTNYLGMGTFCVCATLATRRIGARELGLYGLYSTLAGFEPSLWFRWMGNRDLSGLASLRSLAPGEAGAVIAMAVTDLLLVGFYVHQARVALSAYAEESADQRMGERESTSSTILRPARRISRTAVRVARMLAYPSSAASGLRSE